MMEWAIEQCRARGCGLVQLTSDKNRRDAHRFYDNLGFVASHEGYKLTLSEVARNLRCGRVVVVEKQREPP